MDPSTSHKEGVFLATLGNPVKRGFKTTPQTNKFGGLPDLYDGISLSEDHVRCPACRNVMALILQLYVPLLDLQLERTHYVYACTSEGECQLDGGKWIVYRAQKRMEVVATNASTEKAESKTKAPSKTKDEPKAIASWEPSVSSSIGGWDSWDAPADTSEDFESLLSAAATKATQQSTKQPAPKQKSSKPLEKSEPKSKQKTKPVERVWNGPVLRAHLLDIFPEPGPIDPRALGDTSEEHIMELLREYEMNEGKETKGTGKDQKGPAESSSGGAEQDGGEWDEAYEFVGDKIFYQFQKRIQRCPEQVMRYCLESKPIWATPQPVQEDAKACALCGSPTVCEYQILPALVVDDRPEDEMEPEDIASKALFSRLDYTLVTVLSCVRSCHGTGVAGGLVREHVAVQFT